MKIPGPAVALFLARQETFLQLQRAEPQRSLARVPLVPGLARLHHAPDQHPGKREEESKITTMFQKHIQGIFRQRFRGNRRLRCKRCLTVRDSALKARSARFVLEPADVTSVHRISRSNSRL